MIELSIVFFVSVFIAGVLMFLAPCTLPLVPAYLAFISGVKANDLVDSTKSAAAKKAILINGVLFVIGFSAVFILFGVFAGFFGTYIGQFRNLLSQIGGGLVLLFGLMMLGVIKIEPLMREQRIKVPAFLTPGEPSSAFCIGATFALGWTPCVGPVLASVLLLASTSTTVIEGALLLAVFSLGLAMPFLLTAVMYTRASFLIQKYSEITKWVTYVGGAFLIFIGVLLLTGNFGFTVEYGYKVFNFFGFEQLFDYL